MSKSSTAVDVLLECRTHLALSDDPIDQARLHQVDELISSWGISFPYLACGTQPCLYLSVTKQPLDLGFFEDSAHKMSQYVNDIDVESKEPYEQYTLVVEREPHEFYEYILDRNSRWTLQEGELPARLTPPDRYPIPSRSDVRALLHLEGETEPLFGLTDKGLVRLDE